MQAEYAAAKAKAVMSKLDILMSGRRGVSLKVAIEMYRSLIRPHIEYGIASWALMPEKSMRELEKVQYQSLKRSLGVFQHSPANSLEVISGIMPFRLRVKELCIREWCKLESMTNDHPLKLAMDTAQYNRKYGTPLGYIKYLARDIQRDLSNRNVWVEKRVFLSPEYLLQQTTIPVISIFSQNIGS